MKTVSLELSQQLKEAGYPQKAYLNWWICTNNKGIEPHLMHLQITASNEEYLNEKEDKFINYSSPTADELLEQLPDVEYQGNGYCLSIGHSLDAKWQLDYRDGNDGQLNAWVGDSLADLAAQAWLFLKKENLV